MNASLLHIFTFSMRRSHSLFLLAIMLSAIIQEIRLYRRHAQRKHDPDTRGELSWRDPRVRRQVAVSPVSPLTGLPLHAISRDDLSGVFCVGGVCVAGSIHPVATGNVG
jgi:hypothetical protein